MQHSMEKQARVFDGRSNERLKKIFTGLRSMINA